MVQFSYQLSDFVGQTTALCFGKLAGYRAAPAEAGRVEGFSAVNYEMKGAPVIGRKTGLRALAGFLHGVVTGWALSVSFEHSFFVTANLVRQNGGDPNQVCFVVGLRWWH